MAHQENKESIIRQARLWHRFFVICATLLASVPLLIAGQKVLQGVETIGGVDFFYYLCVARDRLAGDSLHTLRSLSYFPGFAWVWGGVITLFGENLSAVQWVYLATIWMNTLLVGVVVWSFSGALPVSVLSSSLYLWCVLQVEGLEGCLECFTTIPFLLALLVWGSEMRRGRVTVAMMVAGMLGAVSVFMKQQGALLLLGGVGVLPLLWSKKCFVLRAKHIVIACGACFSTLLVLFVLDTDGLAGLASGVRLANTYEAHGNFFENLSGVARVLSPIPEIALISTLAPLVLTLLGRSADRVEVLRRVVTLVAVISSAASLYQFSRRPYLHYAIVTLAPLLVAFGVSFSALLRALVGKIQERVVGSLFLASILLVLFFNRQGIQQQYQRGELIIERPIAQEMAAPFRPICDQVPRGSELFVFPSRRNIIHWLCGTTSTVWPYGYGFAEAPLKMVTDTVHHQRVRFVFVTDASVGDYNHSVEQELKGEPIRVLLRDAGYTSVLKLPSGELFHR